MKNNCFLVLFLMSILYAHGQQLNILTYNIHHGYDVSEHASLDSIASIIGATGANIIGLEEVDSICKRSGNIDQPAYLGRKLKMYHVFVRHFPYQGGSYGLCLLAKYPIINLRNIRLPVMNGDTYSIALLSADIKISRSIVIKTIVAHLDYRNEESRIRQARAIINYCKNTIGPILLMGDFNAPPDSKEIGIVKNDFRDVSAEQFFLTYPDGHPTKKIDYIFFKPPTEWVIKKTQIYHVHASDHLPFQAVLKLRN